MEFDKYSHSPGESNFHFQFTLKYRRDVFSKILYKTAAGKTLGRHRFRGAQKTSIAEIFKRLFLRLTETTINAQGL